jgi:hypothetical protein
MKKSCLFIILFAFICGGWRFRSIPTKYPEKNPFIKIYQQKHNTAIYALSEKDKKLYSLSIDQHKISKPRDTIIYYKKRSYLTVPLKLSNNSNDTLKYINMSCSSFDIFRTDNVSISITTHDCDTNFPMVFTVSPYKSSIIIIHIMFNSITVKTGAKFKIGMHLQKYNNNKRLDLDFEEILKNTKNLIWSNTVEIPGK